MSTKLDKYIHEYFEEICEEDTLATLGLRDEYIGASDIGSCLRKAFLSKQQKEKKHDLNQLIIFERGHVAEEIVAKMLRRLNPTPQVEVTGSTIFGMDIKAHIDFVLSSKKREVVIEVKTTSVPVDSPYESWILQVQMQMGLLKNKLPKKNISGYIVAMDLNTGWLKTFKVVPNQLLIDIAFKRANTLAKGIKFNIEPKSELEAFCSWCNFKENCPSTCSNSKKELPEDVKRVVRKLGELKQAEKELKANKAFLLEFMEATNIKNAKVDDTSITLVTRNNQYDIDLQKLKIEEPEIYSKYRKTTGNTYTYLKYV